MTCNLPHLDYSVSFTSMYEAVSPSTTEEIWQILNIKDNKQLIINFINSSFIFIYTGNPNYRSDYGISVSK